MGFYLRKSIKVGPFRLNLSKSGVGVSAGVKGFRVGTGPRGAYVHAGRGGVYYRQSLGKARRAKRPERGGCTQDEPQSALEPALALVVLAVIAFATFLFVYLLLNAFRPSKTAEALAPVSTQSAAVATENDGEALLEPGTAYAVSSMTPVLPHVNPGYNEPPDTVTETAYLDPGAAFRVLDHVKRAETGRVWYYVSITDGKRTYGGYINPVALKGQRLRKEPPSAVPATVYPPPKPEEKRSQRRQSRPGDRQPHRNEGHMPQRHLSPRVEQQDPDRPR